jgi:hypothetical protein
LDNGKRTNEQGGYVSANLYPEPCLISGHPKIGIGMGVVSFSLNLSLGTLFPGANPTTSEFTITTPAL